MGRNLRTVRFRPSIGPSGRGAGELLPSFFPFLARADIHPKPILPCFLVIFFFLSLIIFPFIQLFTSTTATATAILLRILLFSPGNTRFIISEKKRNISEGGKKTKRSNSRVDDFDGVLFTALYGHHLEVGWYRSAGLRSRSLGLAATSVQRPSFSTLICYFMQSFVLFDLFTRMVYFPSIRFKMYRCRLIDCFLLEMFVCSSCCFLIWTSTPWFYTILLCFDCHFFSWIRGMDDRSGDRSISIHAIRYDIILMTANMSAIDLSASLFVRCLFCLVGSWGLGEDGRYQAVYSGSESFVHSLLHSYAPGDASLLFPLVSTYSSSQLLVC